MSTERTIEEWLSELPDPYATLAIQNAVKRGNLARKAGSMARAIDRMAEWGDTPEGQGFWVQIYDIHEDLRLTTEYPPYPLP